jgi:hypothetical protein
MYFSQPQYFVSPSGGTGCVLGLGLHLRFIQSSYNWILRNISPNELQYLWNMNELITIQSVVMVVVVVLVVMMMTMMIGLPNI